MTVKTPPIPVEVEHFFGSYPGTRSEARDFLMSLIQYDQLLPKLTIKNTTDLSIAHSRLEGASSEDISRELGLPISTVKCKARMIDDMFVKRCLMIKAMAATKFGPPILLYLPSPDRIFTNDSDKRKIEHRLASCHPGVGSDAYRCAISPDGRSHVRSGRHDWTPVDHWRHDWKPSSGPSEASRDEGLPPFIKHRLPERDHKELDRLLGGANRRGRPPIGDEQAFFDRVAEAISEWDSINLNFRSTHTARLICLRATSEHLLRRSGSNNFH